MKSPFTIKKAKRLHKANILFFLCAVVLSHFMYLVQTPSVKKETDTATPFFLQSQKFPLQFFSHCSIVVPNFSPKPIPLIPKQTNIFLPHRPQIAQISIRKFLINEIFLPCIRINPTQWQSSESLPG